jgi:hypothetical protein
MTPLDFIASLEHGEAKTAALAMFKLCAWLENHRGTIGPEVLDEEYYQGEPNVIWLKRNLRTGLLVRCCAGKVAGFDCQWVMENTETDKWEYRLYLGDEPYWTIEEVIQEQGNHNDDDTA